MHTAYRMYASASGGTSERLILFYPLAGAFFLAGPSFWGLINPQWNMCNKGRRQSPIDVVPDKLLFDPYLRPLHIDKHKVRIRDITTRAHPHLRVFPRDLFAGIWHPAQHRPVPGLPGGQGHQTTCEHIRRTSGLPLPVRGDLHTLRHGEWSRIGALYPGLQFPRRGTVSDCVGSC